MGQVVTYLTYPFKKEALKKKESSDAVQLVKNYASLYRKMGGLSLIAQINCSKDKLFCLIGLIWKTQWVAKGYKNNKLNKLF